MLCKRLTMQKKEIVQGKNEVVMHQNVARMEGRLLPIQAKAMNSILKRCYDIVKEKPDTKVFQIPTDVFLEDIQLGDNSSTRLKINSVFVQLKKLMVTIFEWGTKDELNACIFMQEINVDKDFVTLQFSDYIRKHIKPLKKALIIKDFVLLQSFRSEYARQLYKHLMSWDSRQTLEIEVEQLKKFLGVPKTKTYEKMDYFKRKVITPALKEINERCPLMDLQYTNKKKERKITHFSFAWLTQSKKDIDRTEELIRIKKRLIELVGRYLQEPANAKILKVVQEKEKFHVLTSVSESVFIFPSLSILEDRLLQESSLLDFKEG